MEEVRETALGQVGSQKNAQKSWEWDEESSTCLVAVSTHLSHWPCSTYRSKAAATSTPTSYGSVEKTELHEEKERENLLSLPPADSANLTESTLPWFLRNSL